MGILTRSLIGLILAGHLDVAAAQHLPEPQWYVRKTDSGCLYYNQAAWDAKREKEFAAADDSVVWQGSACEKGKFITGDGTLTVITDRQYASGHPGKYLQVTTGHMVDGVFDGLVTGKGGNFGPGYEGATIYPFSVTMVRGCEAPMANRGACIPLPTVASASTVEGRNGATDGASATSATLSDAHIIASNGKSAMDCVKLEKLGGDSALSGGGRVLVNRCSDEVEIGWCYSPGDCDTETGSGWTVQPGKSWPVKAEGEVRWAACHGRDTASFVKGSHGLRYYCKAPAKK